MAKIGKEPARAPAFKDGMLALPTTGMRLAPQVLVLELMREVAYFGTGGATNNEVRDAVALDPYMEGGALSGEEDVVRAAVIALRGRAKERKHQSAFYAPCHPYLAAHGWLRKQSDRVVRDFFIRGALASGVRGNLELTEKVASRSVAAIYGSSLKGVDVMELCATKGARPHTLETPEDAEGNLAKLLNDSPSWGLSRNDEISVRIVRDWLSLCEIEGHLPRIAWIDLVGIFLRTVVPIWILAQMKLCVIVRNFARDACEGRLRSAEDVRSEVNRRNEGLLVPSITLTDSVDQAVIDYMRARVELNVLLEKLASSSDVDSSEVEQPLSVEPQEGGLSIERFGAILSRVGSSGELMRWVIQAAEKYPAWVRPLKDGQGKNIEEFLRVMRNDHVGGQDDGYLLARGAANRRLFRVFPAPKVIALYTLLAQAEKSRSVGGGQRLLLSDFESIWRQLGVDFTLLGGVRAELLRALSQTGILSGTPDAGEGAVLMNPYAEALRSMEELS